MSGACIASAIRDSARTPPGRIGIDMHGFGALTPCRSGWTLFLVFTCRFPLKSQDKSPDSR